MLVYFRWAAACKNWTCPVSKAEKEPRVSDRDISGLIQGPQPLESNA